MDTKCNVKLCTAKSNGSNTIKNEVKCDETVEVMDLCMETTATNCKKTSDALLTLKFILKQDDNCDDITLETTAKSSRKWSDISNNFAQYMKSKGCTQNPNDLRFIYDGFRIYPSDPAATIDEVIGNIIGMIDYQNEEVHQIMVVVFKELLKGGQEPTTHGMNLPPLTQEE